jgi:hypothetical protein
MVTALDVQGKLSVGCAFAIAAGAKRSYLFPVRYAPSAVLYYTGPQSSQILADNNEFGDGTNK